VTNQQKLCSLDEAEVLQAVPAVGSMAVSAGLRFLSSQRRGRKWSCSRTGSEVWTTAYVLARLGELPQELLDRRLREQIEDSLDWLKESQTPGGGWSFAPEAATDNAAATAWTVLAFRHHGREVPGFAKAFLQRCRRPDGAFASHPAPDHVAERGQDSSPETTAIVIRALGIVTSSSAELLQQGLRTAALWQTSPALGLLVCSTVLDWQPGAAPQTLLKDIQRCVCRVLPGSALEQALLLRCLIRLRMQQSWAAAAELALGQQTDGSWAGAPLSGIPLGAMFMDGPIVSTATAVSALAMDDRQGGI